MLVLDTDRLPPPCEHVSPGPLSCGPPLPARIDLPQGAARREPLVAIHGISRDAHAIRAGFLPEMRNAGRALVTPRFGRRNWPHFQRIGKARPDLALLSLLARVGCDHDVQTDKVALFGYSGGAQLVHRFAMIHPHRVAALHVAAAGWYCLPDPTVAWPAGLAAQGNPLADLKLARLDAFLRLPVRLYVGENDTAREAALRQNPALDARQGMTRLERARTYHAAFTAAAQRRGIQPDITLTLLPGCGHDFTECARTGGLARLVCASQEEQK